MAAARGRSALIRLLSYGAKTGPATKEPEVSKRGNREAANPDIALQFVSRLNISAFEVGAGERLANPVRSERKQP